MEPNIQYLIFGSGITLITTLIITIVTNIFQSKRDEKSRLWQIEQDEKKEDIYLIKKRLDEAEACLTRFSNIAATCYDYKKNILDVSGDFIQTSDFQKFSKFIQKKRSKSAILMFLKKEKINEKNFMAKVELSSKSFEDSGLKRQSLQDEMLSVIKELYNFTVLENPEVNEKIADFFELINFEISNTSTWIENIEGMTSVKIDEEKKRLLGFMFQSSTIHGEILQELDRVLVDYKYET